MTRSSEKLAGDWEARIARAVRPIEWTGLACLAAMWAILLLIAGAALFGFG